MRRHLALRGLAVLLILGLGWLGYARADAPRWSALSTLLMWTKADPTGPTEVTAADPLPVTITGAVAGTLTPSTDDGAALGTGALAWSDLFLASGGVINWANGNVTLTHATGTLTLAGGILRLPDGTAAAPSLARNTQVGTGLSFGSEIINFNLNQGTDSIRFTSSMMAVAKDYSLRWSGTSNQADAAATLYLSQAAPGHGRVTTDGSTLGTWSTGTLYAEAGKVTAGSGTGVTVNETANVRTVIYKVTILSTNCVAAATTCDLTIATLPAKTFLKAVIADLTTTYACTAVCTTATLSGTLGTSAGGTQLLASMDLDAATAQFGDADAELGASLNAAARSANGALFNGVLMSWGSTTTVTYRITSGTGNLGDGAATNLSQGAMVFYLVTEVFP